jgi:hypothetical protein
VLLTGVWFGLGFRTSVAGTQSCDAGARAEGRFSAACPWPLAPGPWPLALALAIEPQFSIKDLEILFDEHWWISLLNDILFLLGVSFPRFSSPLFSPL